MKHSFTKRIPERVRRPLLNATSSWFVAGFIGVLLFSFVVAIATYYHDVKTTPAAEQCAHAPC